MTEAQDTDAQFIGWLTGLVPRADDTGGDRGTLAALRRGLGREPGSAPEMFPYVAGWVGERRGWREQCLYLVAALFAAHPRPWPASEDGGGSAEERNLGASFARARTRAKSPEALARRFTALLASDRRELPNRLRQAVSLLRAHDAPVDWYRLLRDLEQWGRDDRRVERAWARSFWRPAGPDGGSPAGNTGEGDTAATAAGAATND